MSIRLLAIVASTALVPVYALAQTSPSQPQQGAQTRAAQPGAQAIKASDFVTRAGVSNMFEIESSKLAEDKAQNERVRQFAEKMIEDHTAAGEKLKAAAEDVQGATVPTSLDQPHTQMVQTLSNTPEAGFDRAYVQMQVRAHRDAVALFEQFAQNGDNPELKQFAQQTVPTLRQHLQTVEQLQSALPAARVGENQGAGNQQQTAQNQAGENAARIVVQQPAPTVSLQQASPQITVQQQEPRVTVNQAQPEILVRQPQPTVTVDIPQPEIIVRMPEPDVNVAMAQPQVQVRQPEPQVQVQQPQQQPQVQVEQAQPQVRVQQAQQDPANVRVQSQGQPQVRYERAEPRVVVNQAEGQPQVRVERMGEGQGQGQANQQQAANRQQQAANRQQQAENQQQPAAQQQAANQQRQAAATTEQAQPQATGALPGAQAMQVSRITDMDLYNTRGNELGDVERVVQAQDGRQFIVIGAGGFLGIGERKVAIPVDQISMQGNRLIIRGVTEDQIRAMPAFDRNGGLREIDDNQQVQIQAMR